MRIPDTLLAYKATYTLQLQLFIIGFGRNLSPATAVYFADGKGHCNRLCVNNCTRTGTNRPSGAVLCDVRPPDSLGIYSAMLYWNHAGCSCSGLLNFMCRNYRNLCANLSRTKDW